MHFWMKKHLSLAAVAVLAAALGSGCSGGAKKADSPSGHARVAVDMSALDGSNVTRITVAVTGAGITSPISADLTKSSTSFQWSGFLDGIPAGTNRTFAATAYNGATAIYGGTATTTIDAGRTAVVVIVLQDLSNPNNQTENVPAITSLTTSDATPIPSILPNAPSKVLLSVTAADRNTPPAALNYAWAASCNNTPVDNGSFDNAALANPVWTAPQTTPGPTICTMSVTVTNSKGSSVKTFLTETVALTNGSANLAAFVNTNPTINALSAKIVYDRASGSQVADFTLAATDPDNDNLAYAWSSTCTGTWSLTAPYSSTNPHYSTPDATTDCVFTVVVSDLCTNGNCGANVPNNPSPRADGSPRGGSVTGTVNGKAPVAATSFPKVVRTTQPVDSQIDAPNAVVNLAVTATDPEGGTLSFLWTPAPGTSFVAGSQNDTVPGTSMIQWIAPASLVPSMPVTVAIKSSKGALLTTVYTFNLKPANPCIGKGTGAACDNGDLCVARGTQTCNAAGVCQGGTSVVTCQASGVCFDVGACNPSTGVCSNPQKAANTSCSTDVCNPATCDAAGVCQTGTPFVNTCTGPAGTCRTTAGVTCVVSTSNTPTCNYPVTNGASCSADHCNPATCNATAACVPGTPVVCNSPGLCETATSATCTPATGLCSYPANTGATCTPTSTPACTANFTCTAAKACTGVADCTVSPSTCCQGSATCDNTTKACKFPVPVPTLAAKFGTSSIAGALDTAGTVYGAGTLYGSATFGTLGATSAGSADAVVVKYDATTRTPIWARLINGGAPESSAATDQFVVGSAVASDSTVAVLGNSNGNLTVPGAVTPVNVSMGPAVNDFVIGLDGASATGVAKWGFAVNNGNGSLNAVAANPTLNLIAICGWADQVSSIAPTGTTFGGGTVGSPAARDAIIAVYDTAGALKWSKQLNSPSPEECNAIAIDDNGDVYVAGKYGTVTGQANLNPGLGQLPATGLGTRRFIWVAKYRGTDGVALVQNSFGQGNGDQTPTALSVDGMGNVVVGGIFSNTLPFGGTTSPLVGAGQDGFVARLNGTTLGAIWSMKFGGPGSTDTVQGVATTSFGEVLVTGTFGGTANLGGLVSASGSDDAYLLKLSVDAGAVQFAAAYGDASSQSGLVALVNRSGTGSVKDLAVFGGTYAGTITFPAPAGSLTSAAGESFLVWAPIQ
jgi:hypothetical protein